MNVQHLLAFCWLRWRLFVNPLTKGSIVNSIILAVLSAILFLAALAVFCGSFLLGLFAFGSAETSPVVLLLVWDALVLLFLFGWSVGLLTELQRTEAFSTDKFLHLPVSLSGVFVLNYLSSLVSLNLILFVPLMVGLALGLVGAKGPAMLAVLPLVAAFFLMVTALTYQFQGWLASLMVNKRRRRTIVVMVTLAFVLVFQIPNLINFYQPWNRMTKDGQQAKEVPVEDVSTQAQERLDELRQAFEQKKISVQQWQDGIKEVQDKLRRQQIELTKVHDDSDAAIWSEVQDWAWTANMILPPGWLPLGAAAAAEGNVQPALIGVFGLTLIGTLSLRRSYRTTLRLYTGQFTTGTKAAAAKPTLPAQPQSATFLERSIPGVSEQAAVIALASFRSLLRAPEVKMLLLSPIILIVVFGGLFAQGSLQITELLRPLLAVGAIAMVLLSLMQLAGNQFGFDRSGFRLFVLSPVSRDQILLGKNLALFPLAALLTSPMIILLQVLRPLRFDHLLAVPLQFVSMYLLFCMLANVMSLLCPMPISAGSLKPATTRLLPILMGFAFLLMLPAIQTPILLPLVIEGMLESVGLGYGVPMALLLTLLECGVILFIYPWVLHWEGELLQMREETILEMVTMKVDS